MVGSVCGTFHLIERSSHRVAFLSYVPEVISSATLTRSLIYSLAQPTIPSLTHPFTHPHTSTGNSYLSTALIPHTFGHHENPYKNQASKTIVTRLSTNISHKKTVRSKGPSISNTISKRSKLYLHRNVNTRYL